MFKTINEIKTTLEMPKTVLNDALEASGKSLNETVIMGLKLVAAQKAFGKLRSMRRKYKSKIKLSDLRDEA